MGLLSSLLINSEEDKINNQLNTTENIINGVNKLTAACDTPQQVKETLNTMLKMVEDMKKLKQVEFNPCNNKFPVLELKLNKQTNRFTII